MPAELTVIWWRDIPAQVVAGQGRGAVRAVLSDRFQEAIDLAATRAGLIGTDDYLDAWRKVSSPCEGDLDTAVAAEAERLEAAYPDDVLDVLARDGGVAG
ncbi:MAG TPA: virulence factor [Actinomycetota bacterium]